MPGGSVFPTACREGCPAPRALGAQKPPVVWRCWSRAVPRPPARAWPAGSAGDVLAFCRRQGGDGVFPFQPTRCPICLSQPRWPPDGVSVGGTCHDAREEEYGLRGSHGLNRISAAEHRSHLRWLSSFRGPWAGQGCTEKVGRRAGSAAAAPQVTLAGSRVAMFSVLVRYRGSCHHGLWLIELKEQR